MLRKSVHLTTLFAGQAWLSGLNQYFVHILSLVQVTDYNLLNQQKEENDYRNQSPQKYGKGPGSYSRPLDL